MILRAGNTQWAGATQILPTGLSQEQGRLALENFSKAFQLQFKKWGSEDDSKPVALPKDIFKWKEFRTPTKNLLIAIANSLQVTLPTGWSFSDCVPTQLLVPRTSDGERVLMIPAEKKALGLESWCEDMDLRFVYNSDATTRWPDFYMDHDNFYRLCFSADEGTEAWSRKPFRLTEIDKT